MSEQQFKAGDKVRYSGGYENWNTPEFIGHTGVVAVGGEITTRVEWDDIPGRDKPYSTGIYNENLELVSYTPQVGDKVRLIVEGVVQTAAVGGKEFYVETEPGEGWRVYGKADYTVELIEKAPEPPKPFPVGTLAGWEDGSHFAVKLADGWRWRFGGDGPSSSLTDERVRGFVEREPNFNILYEPTSA